MLAYLPAGVARVLEIGCDEGDFGAQLNAEVWGVEPQADAAARAATASRAGWHLIRRRAVLSLVDISIPLCATT
jgi:hypothetical protein